MEANNNDNKKTHNNVMYSTTAACLTFTYRNLAIYGLQIPLF